MPRQERQIFGTGYHHVIVKGHNDIDVFRDDSDRIRFLDTVMRFRKEMGFGLAAYCLMTNHVHMLIYDPKRELPRIMKKILVSYVMYFNKKYARRSSLFADRYFSKPVLDNDYFSVVVRYIHKNPEEAGICGASEYKWSSYGEYENPTGTIDNADALARIGSFSDLMERSAEGLTSEEQAQVRHEQEEQLRERIELSRREKRREAIMGLHLKGATYAEIAKTLGISVRTVYREMQAMRSGEKSANDENRPQK